MVIPMGDGIDDGLSDGVRRELIGWGRSYACRAGTYGTIDLCQYEIPHLVGLFEEVATIDLHGGKRTTVFPAMAVNAFGLSCLMEKVGEAGILLPADLLFENGTRLEGENLAGGDGEGVTGLGVATDPVVLLVDDELAESCYLDFLTGGKSILDDVQDGLHHLLGFFPLEPADVTNFFDEVFFGHGRNFYHEWMDYGKGEWRQYPFRNLAASSLLAICTASNNFLSGKKCSFCRSRPSPILPQDRTSTGPKRPGTTEIE